MKRPSFMAVDPGLTGTGYAIWQDGKLVAAANLTPPRGGDFVDRSFWLGRELAARTVAYYSRQVVCEFPQFFQSTGGQMVAASGDLQRLTFLVGVIAGCVRPLPFRAVLVNEWKGQLPKKIVADRVTATLGHAAIRKFGVKSHTFDALGIGLFHLGYF